MALINIACAGQLRTTWTNVDVARLIESEVGSAKGAIGACRLVPHRNVRRNLAIHQPFEQPDRSVSGVACQSLGPQIEATLNTLHHGLGDSDLHCAVRARPAAPRMLPSSFAL